MNKYCIECKYCVYIPVDNPIIATCLHPEAEKYRDSVYGHYPECKDKGNNIFIGTAGEDLEPGDFCMLEKGVIMKAKNNGGEK